MDFIDRIRELSARIPKQLAHIQTEEAAKHAFVMPFIAALGYDVFNPLEVVPEFTADVGTKKGEKVDYAIMQDGKPVILFECKLTKLDHNHASQLVRYFTVTETRFAVLTNGVHYRFFSDLEKPNRMDEKPFFELDLQNITDRQVEELKKFTKPRFDLEDILATASELKYTRELKRALTREFETPSDEFVRYFTKQVYSGIFNQTARERFTAFVSQAVKQFTNDLVSQRLQSALAQEEPPPPLLEEQLPELEEESDPKREIHTTQEELEAYFIVKTILREVVDSKRIMMRDTLSYCGVLFDDNNRKPVCRLHFNRVQKYFGVLDESKNETRHAIDDIDDIYQYADALKRVTLYYDKNA
jgi:hypothetical protein